ncbi:MAG: DNA repair protein RadC [Candidatus Sungbacteria bacterium]|nr:DNA repair protein RadC [Candidatus Sungbacteria bacterium]
MLKHTMKIKDLPSVERPREKLQKYGAGKLSNSELLAILLRTGTKGKNAVEIATQLLQKFGSAKIADAGIAELAAAVGLGRVKAGEIVACFELGRRMLQQRKHDLYMSAEDVWTALRDIRDHKKEHFVIFFLDTRNQEIRRETISVGTLNANLVHPREVFEPAILHAAAHVIVAHNHPSGNPDPSDEDQKVTRRLVEAGKILGIALLDHIIVARSGHYSFKAHHLIAE